MFAQLRNGALRRRFINRLSLSRGVSAPMQSNAPAPIPIVKLSASSGGRTTRIDDLHAPVLRLAHPVAGRNQQVTLALGHDLDLAGGDTILLQLSRDRF